MTYFEDFSVGERMRHARGKTITDVEVATLCHLVMNTHQAHFNAQFMAGTPFEQPIAFGGITAAIVVGLAMQDTGEHALAELGLREVRFPAPVVAGDTLHALTEVLGAEDDERAGAGRVTFQHWGVNQRDEVVFEGRRQVLVMRR
jgi:itaconyl-CoA hydratase